MKLSTAAGTESLTPQDTPYKEKYQHWSTKLSEKLSTRVTVKLNNNGVGRVVIHVDSPDEIDWLLDHLKVE